MRHRIALDVLRAFAWTSALQALLTLAVVRGLPVLLP
jgi:hypothetical protein